MSKTITCVHLPSPSLVIHADYFIVLFITIEGISNPGTRQASTASVRKREKSEAYAEVTHVQDESHSSWNELLIY